MVEVDVFERYPVYTYYFKEKKIEFDFIKMEYNDTDDLTINGELSKTEEYVMLKRLMKLKHSYENKLITNDSELREFSILKKKYENLCQNKVQYKL